MSERFKVHDWKSCCRRIPARGFESPSLRHEVRACRIRRAFCFVKNGMFKGVKSCFCPHFAPTLFFTQKKPRQILGFRVLNYLFQGFFYSDFEIRDKVSIGIHRLLECAMAKSVLESFEIYTFFQKQRGVCMSEAVKSKIG